MNREYLLGAISVYLLIVFHVVRALWLIHFANKLEPTVMIKKNIVENDLMKLSQVEMLQDKDVKKIYKSLTEGGIFRIKTIKIHDNIFWVKLNGGDGGDGGDGYFTLYKNRVDTISVNHVIMVRNGILLHCPVQDDKEYIISD